MSEEKKNYTQIKNKWKWNKQSIPNFEGADFAIIFKNYLITAAESV